MSYNKFNEYELGQILIYDSHYFITRDRAGNHVLREGSFDGSELYALRRDDGKKNTKKERVISVDLLYQTIDSKHGG